MNAKEITINNVKFQIVPRPATSAEARKLIGDGFCIITDSIEDSGEATLEREAAAALSVPTPFFVKFEYI